MGLLWVRILLSPFLYFVINLFMPQLDLNMFFDVIFCLNVFFVGFFIFFLLIFLPKIYFDLKLWFWKIKKLRFFFFLNDYKNIRDCSSLKRLSSDFFFF